MTRQFKLTSDYVPPRTRFNRTISGHRVVEGRTFPLKDIKAIRALLPEAKVNDVALSIVGGALNKYLTAKNDLPKSTMTAMAPISVRSGEEKGDMGNQVSAMIAPLGSHLADPVERLEYVFSQTKNSKALPNAIGAAVACPDRPVYAVSGDGSAMYQVQCLWTAAREGLNTTFIIVANRGYQILHHELEAQGAPKPGRNARAMFDIEAPLLDWVALANGQGVAGRKVATEDAFADALAAAAATDGPFLIEAAI